MYESPVVFKGRLLADRMWVGTRRIMAGPR